MGIYEYNEQFHIQNERQDAYQMCRKTPSFSYGDIRHVHRIYASN